MVNCALVLTDIFLHLNMFKLFTLLELQRTLVLRHRTLCKKMDEGMIQRYARVVLPQVFMSEPAVIGTILNGVELLNFNKTPSPMVGVEVQVKFLTKKSKDLVCNIGFNKMVMT
mmetsp:Transcript_426/g.555  ORF Transcript_426/g.555 Transcript_426/m.555 type:complete len:114 (+) Transcript_426:1098-1439(+)